ncbi:MAG: TonB-dependent receptor, partial [Gammaproteobacteria bacterium]|nr:TonB-dependent receptor [Gammaproteobacteria bacterium]
MITNSESGKLTRARAARSLSLLTAMGAISIGGTAAAQSTLDEIIVSAQKRDQSIQDLGIAVTAFSGEEIERLGFNTSTDIAAMTPGVHLAGSIGGQFTTFSIRGVTQNDFLDHTEAPNAVYVDEGYIASMQGQSFALFDLERVEILKGPQGTLFGRNATGGLVHYISRKPTDMAEASFAATYGRFNQLRLEGGIGGPLADGVTARIAFLHNQHDPIYTNLVPGADDIWNDNTTAARGHLSFDLSDNVNLLLTVHGGRSRMGTAPYKSRQTIAVVNEDGLIVNSILASPSETRECIGPGGINFDCGNDLTGTPDGFTLVRPVPGGDFFGFRDEDPGSLFIAQDSAYDDLNWVRTHGGTANLGWSMGAYDLTLVTDAKRLSKEFYLDADASPLPYLNTFQQAENESFSQEVRLSYAGDELRWVAGAYYLHIDAEVPGTGFILPPDNQAPTVVAFGLQGFAFSDQYRLKTNSYSAFAQGEYDVTSDLTMVVGGRLTREQKSFDYRSDIFVGVDRVFDETAIFAAQARGYECRLGYTLFTGKVALEYRLEDDALLYASLNRGVKAGGFNAPFGGGAAITDDVIPYESEQLNSLEIGFKSELLDRTMRLNGALYFYDYKDYQAFKLIGLTTQVVNADARYYGGELELLTQPMDGLTLATSASYIKTKVKDIDFLGVIADREAAFTPEWQLTGLVRYEFPFAVGRLALQADGHYKSSFYYSLSN